jgi:kinesin family protein 1
MDKGDKNRSVGKTAMNATSSRAHTVVTISFSKITNSDGSKLVTESEINLVDLAGSEKSTQANTSGESLKEGNAIN